ncbi:MAG: LemA family protein [Firmicutes bacterium]|nr:LemA family protein [Bacillota bacterium]
MNLLNNKFLCLVLMVVLIAAGTWIGGYKGLNGLYSQAEDIFFTGERGDGICIANDLAERAAAAANLVTIASNYAGVQDEAQAVTAASAELSAELSATTRDGHIARLSERNRKLDSAMTALYNALGEESLMAQHEKYRQSLYADFNSRNDTISHDPYNQYAQDYNQALDGFPASLLAAITPVPSQAVIFY